MPCMAQALQGAIARALWGKHTREKRGLEDGCLCPGFECKVPGHPFNLLSFLESEHMCESCPCVPACQCLCIPVSCVPVSQCI